MDRKIKVAHIITLLELGGAQQNTLYTIEHLDREKFEPILICGRGGFLDDQAERLGCRVDFLNSLVRPVSPLRDLFALFEIFFVLRREKPDIVHTHSSKAGILGRLAARLAKVPVILHTFHGFGFNPEQSFLTRFFYVALEKLAAGVSQGLIAVSKSNLEEAISRGIGTTGKYHLIRSGVSLALYSSIKHKTGNPPGISLDPGQKLITTIGPFKPQKNLLDFVLAAGEVYAKYPNARFLIVGDGDLRGEIQDEIRRQRLEKVVFLPGWRRDIPELFQRTDIFVMTSLWEGLPRALVEAMAAGLPCVANAVDGVKDVVSEGMTGFLVPPHQPEKTAERILYLLHNPQFAAELGRQARQSIADDFDIDKMVRQQEELYRKLVP